MLMAACLHMLSPLPGIPFPPALSLCARFILHNTIQAPSPPGRLCEVGSKSDASSPSVPGPRYLYGSIAYHAVVFFEVRDHAWATHLYIMAHCQLS